MPTYPLAGLFDLCGIADATFWPLSRQELSRTAKGATQAKDLGSALWRASFTTAPQLINDAAALEAALISLNGSVGSFLAHDPRRPFPRAYPAGDFADTGTIHTLYPAEAYKIKLEGLPDSFQLSPGDYLGFQYGTRPTRALHMVVEPVTAFSSGVTPKFEIFPALRPGALVGAAVTLKRAPCEMILEPNQAPPVGREMLASSVTFSAVQLI